MKMVYFLSMGLQNKQRVREYVTVDVECIRSTVPTLDMRAAASKRSMYNVQLEIFLCDVRFQEANFLLQGEY